MSIYDHISDSLKLLSNFSLLEGHEKLQFDGQSIFKREETPIGIYSHYTGRHKGTVLITNLGLYVLQDLGFDYIEYAEMESVDQKQAGPNTSMLVLKLRNGTSKSIPIIAGDDQKQDTSLFCRFLSAVIADMAVS